ncbi:MULTISPECIES: TspO/MBR family protein [unclassified Micromonospora]|uniref:TspO/MBR family protein n=1 Tax=unclassified Micromonospora TaxID=2617518 RepID=UPI001590790E|nr:TspO/MBR family protein [Verrucosispora sp. NA02020]QKW15936.1 tryptophan-rich sensory protein [Verrucosispora sp. NA02020]
MRTSASDTRRGGARQWWALAGFAAAVIAAAVIGNLAAVGAADEYRSVEQPSWAPPSWLFGPVWTLLYVTIALAGWLVWRRVGFGPAVLAWVVQLALNAAWTPLFFGAGRYGLAFAEIVLLWLAIGVTVLLFRRVSTAAAVLLLPYWAWVTFAAALNYSIWQLNG